MSLPSPTTTTSTSIRSIYSEEELKEWDGPLAVLAQKSKGDLRQLMYAFFSFLHRRTDFYVVRPSGTTSSSSNIGFKEGEAEQILLAAFRQFPLVKIPPPKGTTTSSPKQSGVTVPTSSRTTRSDSKTAASTTVDAGDDSSDQGPPPSSTGTKEEATMKREVHDSSYNKQDDTQQFMAMVRYTKEGKQIPMGNGGCTDRYHWTQTIHETSVIAKLPRGTKAKDLQVTIRPTSVSVSLKAPPSSSSSTNMSSTTNATAAAAAAAATTTTENTFILNGDLVERIRPEESTWTIEGNVLLLTLDKVKKTWWATVFVGDDEIDTQLVDSTRKISEYDEATQGAIRKIMFDQNQQRLGLPTSDQILGKPSYSGPTLPAGVEYIDSETLKTLQKQSK
jgi:hypothetical protein